MAGVFFTFRQRKLHHGGRLAHCWLMLIYWNQYYTEQYLWLLCASVKYRNRRYLCLSLPQAFILLREQAFILPCVFVLELFWPPKVPSSAHICLVESCLSSPSLGLYAGLLYTPYQIPDSVVGLLTWWRTWRSDNTDGFRPTSGLTSSSGLMSPVHHIHVHLSFQGPILPLILHSSVPNWTQYDENLNAVEKWGHCVWEKLNRHSKVVP